MPLAGLVVPAPAAAAQEAAQNRIRRGWQGFFTAIRPAIERRDSSLEPLDLLPRSVAVERCVEAAAGKLDEAGRAVCEKESAAVSKAQAARDKLAKRWKRCASRARRAGADFPGDL